MSQINPGQTIGILGGGQLGRMICLAARRMGYRTLIYCPDGIGPASQAADGITIKPWDDLEGLSRWLDQVDVVTVEFENVPYPCMELAEKKKPARPSSRVLRVAQHRRLEKQTLADAGLPVTPFCPIDSPATVAQAIEQLGLPLVLKTIESGYDGKGQTVIRSEDEGLAFLQRNAHRKGARLEKGESVLLAEKWIPFEREVSVLVARDIEGRIELFPPIENQHVHHIIDLSFCPARNCDQLSRQVHEIAASVAKVLDLVGLLCIEFFVTQDQRALINEIAPRPHNSGHLTIEAFPCDQFQQLVRAVCGLPLAPPRQTRPAAMVNLLGDLWFPTSPKWERALAVPETSLHLYGKSEPRAGRKMGHLTSLGDTVDEAIARARCARQLLSEQHTESIV